MFVREISLLFMLTSLDFVQGGSFSAMWLDPAVGEAQNIYICENFPAGETVMTLVALGDDLTFSIDSSSTEALKLFEIVWNELKIKETVTDELDYEGDTPFRNISITLVATDGIGEVPIDCIIFGEDANDNSPVYSAPSYTTVIPVTHPFGGSVFKVNATDADGSSKNNQISYNISGEHADMFLIDNDGLITLAEGVTLAAGKSYSITIVAADNNPEAPLSAEAVLTVNVNKAPVFVSPDPEAEDKCKIYICESAQANDTVITFAATDDFTDVEFLTYNIDQSLDEVRNLFEVDGRHLKVKPDIAEDYFDYEADNARLEFPIVVEVSDGSSSRQLSTIACIEDLNDNPPVLEGPFTRTIAETTAGGTPVFVVKVTDNDGTPENKQVTLTMDGSDTFEFNRDTKTVSVKAGVTLDYDTQSEYLVLLVATDNAVENALTTRQNYSINIATGPKFTAPVDEETLTREEKDTFPGATLKQITVEDKDGDNVTVSILSQDPAVPSLFRVGPEKALIFQDAVDVDAVGAVTSYTLQLMVTDGRDYTENDTIVVTVNIIDSNEKPTFAEPAVSRILKEWATEGNTVYTAQATDNDITVSFGQSSLRYSMIGTPVLEIDPETGDIRIATGADINYNVKQNYTVTVTATDGGSLTDSMEIFFSVVTGPVFEDPMDKAELTITEKDTGVNALVKDLVTSDKDNDADRTIEVVQQEPPTTPLMFAIINKNQFVITSAVDVDAQNAVSLYSVILQVSDGIDVTRNSSINVTVKIEDSNDERPMFANQEYSTDVVESSKRGTVILTVIATDGDKTSMYNTLYYVLSSASEGVEHFAVNKTTGAIAVEKDLDYDKKTSYDLTLLAVDGTTEPLSGGTKIKIKVVTAPQFDNLKEAMTAEVDENAAVNTDVFKLQISDKDQQAEGTTVTTTIDSQTPDDMFKLVGTTLKTKRTGFDADAPPTNYTIVFKAKDDRHETISAKLTVKVKDKNDESPRFPPINDVIVAENKSTIVPDSEIIEIKATDDDVTEINNNLTYSIMGGNGEELFAIDSDTGMLRLVKTPVSMTTNEHTLTIKAVDGGSPQHEATASVKVIFNEKIVEECTSTLCKNGATCMSFVNTYSCKCVLGFNERHCENNIDDCTPDPCKNGGQCIDGVNSFMCDCQEGWTGGTCTEACNNNKYGRNCVKDCSCNPDGLGNVGNQMCHVQNGDCFCNDRWVGNRCHIDVDECTKNLDNCNSVPNKICNNTLGGYNCICQQGYNENNDGTCAKRTPVPVIIGVGEFAVNVVIALDITRPCPDLTIPSVYRVEEIKIITLFLARTVALRVIVLSIGCGSLVYELNVVASDTESDSAALAKGIQDIRDAGTLDLDGESVTVKNVSVENREVTPSSQSSGGMEESVCSVYTSYTECGADKKCQYENGVASCKNIAVDNLTIILGLGLGLLLPFLLAAMIFAIAWYMVKRRRINKRKHRKLKYEESSSSGRTHFPTRYYDNARYSNSSLYSITGYHGMPAVDVVKYGRQWYRY